MYIHASRGLCSCQQRNEGRPRTMCGTTASDGHDKPFCTEAISIISKKLWAIPIIDKSQFLKAISVIDKLLPVNFSINVAANYPCV